MAIKREREEYDDEVENPSKSAAISYAHAFKLLCPEPLCAAILGSGGECIQHIQNETESKISFAGRSDRYETTNQRLCLIRAHSTEAIDAALGAILDQLREIVDAPRKSDAELTDIVTKNGDYRVKCVMPKTAAGAMIGTKGSNVSELREATGIHVVWVEEGSIGQGETAEQIVSLVGTMDAIGACLTRINVFVQDVADHAWFRDWSHLRVNGRGIPGPKLGHPKLVDNDPISRQQAADNAMVNRALLSMPVEQIHDRQFSVRASLPVDSMSALIGKAGCTTKDIMHQTGAKVTLKDEDPNTTVSIEGSIQAVLSGYCLIMKKYLEFEQGKEEKGRGKGARVTETVKYEEPKKRETSHYEPRTVIKSDSKGKGKEGKGKGSSKGKGKGKEGKGKGKGKSSY